MPSLSRYHTVNGHSLHLDKPAPCTDECVESCSEDPTDVETGELWDSPSTHAMQNCEDCFPPDSTPLLHPESENLPEPDSESEFGSISSYFQPQKRNSKKKPLSISPLPSKRLNLSKYSDASHSSHSSHFSHFAGQNPRTVQIHCNSNHPLEKARRAVETSKSLLLNVLKTDLMTVEGFYSRTKSLLQEELHNIYRKCEVIEGQRRGGVDSLAESVSFEGLTISFREILRALEMLRSYCQLNYAAFASLLNYHDSGPSVMRNADRQLETKVLSFIEKGRFHRSTWTSWAESQLLQKYANTFLVTPQKAAFILRGSGAEHETGTSAFRTGLIMGINLCLFVALALLVWIIPSALSYPFLSASAPLLRLLIVAIVFIYAWGTVLWACEKTNVNYVFVLNLNPSTALSSSKAWFAASSLAFIVLASSAVCSILYLRSWVSAVEALHSSSATATTIRDLFSTPTIVHCLIFIAMAFLTFSPFPFAFLPTRKYIGKNVGAVLLAPFCAVNFERTFIGDQLCSLTKVFFDVVYAVCFYFGSQASYLLAIIGLIDDFPDGIAPSQCRPFVKSFQWALAFLPFSLRLCQCYKMYFKRNGDMRQVFNGGKYAVSMVMTLSALLFKSSTTSMNDLKATYGVDTVETIISMDSNSSAWNRLSALTDLVNIAPKNGQDGKDSAFSGVKAGKYSKRTGGPYVSLKEMKEYLVNYLDLKKQETDKLTVSQDQIKAGQSDSQSLSQKRDGPLEMVEDIDRDMPDHSSYPRSDVDLDEVPHDFANLLISYSDIATIYSDHIQQDIDSVDRLFSSNILAVMEGIPYVPYPNRTITSYPSTSYADVSHSLTPIFALNPEKSSIIDSVDAKNHVLDFHIDASSVDLNPAIMPSSSGTGAGAGDLQKKKNAKNVVVVNKDDDNDAPNITFNALAAQAMVKVNRVIDHIISSNRWMVFFRTLFLCTAITATFYSFLWDLRYDWGLLESGPSFPLRTKSVFNGTPDKKRMFYYSAISINLLLRCAWVDTLLPTSLGVSLLRDYLFVLMITVFEVFLRMLWNFIRLENEHLNNVGEFRSLNIIIPDLPVIQNYSEPKKQTQTRPQTQAQPQPQGQGQGQGQAPTPRYGFESEPLLWMNQRSSYSSPALRGMSVSPSPLDPTESTHLLAPSSNSVSNSVSASLSPLPLPSLSPSLHLQSHQIQIPMQLDTAAHSVKSGDKKKMNTSLRELRDVESGSRTISPLVDPMDLVQGHFPTCSHNELNLSTGSQSHPSSHPSSPTHDGNANTYADDSEVHALDSPTSPQTVMSPSKSTGTSFGDILLSAVQKFTPRASPHESFITGLTPDHASLRAVTTNHEHGSTYGSLDQSRSSPVTHVHSHPHVHSHLSAPAPGTSERIEDVLSPCSCGPTRLLLVAKNLNVARSMRVAAIVQQARKRFIQLLNNKGQNQQKM